MLVMTLNGYNKRSGGYHGTWFHPMQGGMKLQRGGELQERVYSDLGGSEDTQQMFPAAGIAGDDA